MQRFFFLLVIMLKKLQRFFFQNKTSSLVLRKKDTNSSESVSAVKVKVQNFSLPVTLSSWPIPDELVFEIFSRLPSQDIARCRCVSKLWSSILRSEYFTELFLTKSCAHPQLLFAFHDDNEVVFFSSPQPHNPKGNSYVVATNHLARFSGSEFSCTTGFSCYGVNLIISNYEYEKVICNPSTGQSLTLPVLNSTLKVGMDNYLGYDPIAKEFKLLSMISSCVSGRWISNAHQVLTLGTKNSSWRLVQCCIPHYTSRKWICISGVLYYAASAYRYSLNSMVACFDLRSEKFSFVKFMETSSRAMHHSTTLVNYDGKLGLISHASKSLELWVLRDAEKHEWSKHVYVLPSSWKDVVTETMRFIGMVGTSEMVLSPSFQYVSSYIIYFNVESKRIRKVGIQGLEAFQGKRFYTFLNYVENVKLL